MLDVTRLDCVNCTTALEVELLAALVDARRKLMMPRSAPRPRPRKLEPKPEPPKPVVKLVPAEPSKPFRGPPAREAGIKRIQLAVCKKFNITRNEMMGAYRHRRIAEARHVAVMLCYALTAHSYPFIGRWFSYRDHSTMLNSVRVMRNVHDALVKELTSNDPLFDWVDRAHELVMAGRAQPRCDSVEKEDNCAQPVLDIAAERASFKETPKEYANGGIPNQELETVPALQASQPTLDQTPQDASG